MQSAVVALIGGCRRPKTSSLLRSPLLLLFLLAPTCAQPTVEGDGGASVPCGGKRVRRCCGDGKCNGPESIVSCPEDCPGVKTDLQCGEEPHSDTAGYAVVFGINHRAATAQDCCDKCREHAAKPRNAKRP